MLRKEIDELQILKTQVQELAQEVAGLKSEMNAKSSSNKELISNDSGRGFGKVIGRSMMKQDSVGDMFSNKQMFNQLVKAVSYAMRPGSGAPSSFGK